MKAHTAKALLLKGETGIEVRTGPDRGPGAASRQRPPQERPPAQTQGGQGTPAGRRGSSAGGGRRGASRGVAHPPFPYPIDFRQGAPAERAGRERGPERDGGGRPRDRLGRHVGVGGAGRAGQGAVTRRHGRVRGQPRGKLRRGPHHGAFRGGKHD